MDSERKEPARKVVFVVEDVEQIGDADRISSRSPYFAQLVSQFTPDQVLLLLRPTPLDRKYG